MLVQVFSFIAAISSQSTRQVFSQRDAFSAASYWFSYTSITNGTQRQFTQVTMKKNENIYCAYGCSRSEAFSRCCDALKHCKQTITFCCWHWINSLQSQLADLCFCWAEGTLTIPMCPGRVQNHANLATFIPERVLELQCGLEWSFKVVQEHGNTHLVFFFILFLKSCSSSLLFNCNYFNENIIITPREARWIYFSLLISFLNPWPPNFPCYSSASRATELIRSIWGCGKVVCF